ncbi:MAG TPA: DUF4215 domain-containing protein [Kofleriaceae bacterium]|nr:DUF4215 domain-containing protein [Kofleriaceae bacterium]
MRAAALAITLCGCNAILGIGDVHTSSGTPDAAPDASPDASVPVCGVATPNTVVGCSHIRHFLYDNSTAYDDLDLSALTVQAYVYDPTTMTFAVKTGAGKKDGTFAIPDVPDGASFYLSIADPNAFFPGYWFTDQRVLDLGFSQSGRPTKPVTADSEVTLNVTGMTPWHSLDSVYISGINVGDSAYVTTGSTLPPPTVGATTLGETFDWRTTSSEQTMSFQLGLSVRPPGVMDSPADDLTVDHAVLVPVADTTGRSFTYSNITESFRKTDVGMSDGTPLAITGAFSPAPLSPNTLSWSADLSAMRAALGHGDRHTNETIDCQRWASPGTGGLWGGELVADMGGSTMPDMTNLAWPGQAFRNPAPAIWQQFMSCTFGQYRAIRPPGTQGYRQSVDYIRIEATATNAYKVSPTITAPTGLQLSGVAVSDGGAVPFDGTKAPVLSWTAVAGATRYFAILLQWQPGSGFVFLGTFHTSGTSLPIPAQLLEVGGFYYFRIAAVQDKSDYNGGHLLEMGFPWSFARTSTNVIRLSSLCGNGNVDSGEECDTAGASATCNADCSKATCGDTHVNTFTGEQCDNGTDDTPTCDGATCKHPVCGDGHQNYWAEECDDGNTSSGDGCSSGCKLERCGDGKLDPFESCDDGNPDYGDGCSPRCQQEPGFTCDTSMTPTTCTRQ